jgi:outer membrane protein assembly factor BamB
MNIGALLWHHEQASTAIPLKQGKSSVYALRVSDGTILWQKLIGQGQEGFASWLLVDQSVVYTSMSVLGNSQNTGIVAALRGSDGALIWQNAIGGGPTGAVLSDGMIYASVDGSIKSAVYALQALDGAPRWSYPVDGDVFYEPVLASAFVYVGANSGIVYALHAQNGDDAWYYRPNLGS